MADPYTDIVNDHYSNGSDPYTDIVNKHNAAKNDITQGVKRGLYQTGSNLARFGEGASTALGFDAGKDFFAKQAKSASKTAQDYAPQVGGFGDVDGLGSFVDYAQGLAAEQVPNMGLSLAGAAAGASAGAKLPGALKPIGTLGGGIAGAFVPSFFLNTGEVYGEQRENNVDNFGGAAKTGLGMAALDALVPGNVAGKVLSEPVKGAFKQGVKQGLKETAKAGATGFIKGSIPEGLTEAAQEELAIRHRADYDPSYDIYSPEAAERRREALIAGGLVGGITNAGADVTQTALPQGPLTKAANKTNEVDLLRQDSASGVPAEEQALGQWQTPGFTDTRYDDVRRPVWTEPNYSKVPNQPQGFTPPTPEQFTDTPDNTEVYTPEIIQKAQMLGNVGPDILEEAAVRKLTNEQLNTVLDDFIAKARTPNDRPREPGNAPGTPKPTARERERADAASLDAARIGTEPTPNADAVGRGPVDLQTAGRNQGETGERPSVQGQFEEQQDRPVSEGSKWQSDSGLSHQTQAVGANVGQRTDSGFTHEDPTTGERYQYLGGDEYRFEGDGQTYNFNEGELTPLEQVNGLQEKQKTAEEISQAREGKPRQEKANELPESLISNFPDAITGEGAMPLNRMSEEERESSRSLGFVQTFTTSSGNTYEGVDEEYLWKERQRRQDERVKKRKDQKNNAQQTNPSSPTAQPNEPQSTPGQANQPNLAIGTLSATQNAAKPTEQQQKQITTATKQDTFSEPQSQAKAAQEKAATGTQDPILTQKKNSYVNQQIKARGIKKGSPGYQQAVDGIKDEYEDNFNRALAKLPFDEFKAHPVNAEVPEGALKQSYDALRDEYGVTDETTNQVTGQVPIGKAQAKSRDTAEIPQQQANGNNDAQALATGTKNLPGLTEAQSAAVRALPKATVGKIRTEANKAITNDSEKITPQQAKEIQRALKEETNRRGDQTSDGVVAQDSAKRSEVSGEEEVKAEPKAKEQGGELEDFGEKLGGARKDEARKFSDEVKEMTDEKIASLPLNKIFPKKVIEDTEDTFSAAYLTAIREVIPSKPRVSYRVKSWVEKVKTVMSLADNLRGFTPEQILAKMRNEFRLGDFANKVELLMTVDRDQWHRIGGVADHSGAYRFGKDNEKIPSPSFYVEIDGKRENIEGAKTISDTFEPVKKLLQGEAAEKQMQFEIRGRTGSYFINKTGDKERRRLKTFTDLKEARAYLRNNNTDLVKAWEAVKERDNVKKSDVRSKENKPRTGQDYRKGKDVDEQMFMDTFGFRGVEFGNWVKQGKGGKDRQGLLNQAYDAFMDLANILNIPPQAISLNGSLGLGLGSRGKGGFASAHYEPDNIVINLTKTKGAGSLAHEWFHSLDNYFSRQRGGEVQIKRGLNAQEAYRTKNFITYKPERMYVSKRFNASPLTREELTKRQQAYPTAELYKEENWQPDPNHPEGVRPEVEAKFAELVETLNESPMFKRSQKNDKQPDGYWSRIIERGARAFENYIIAKMQKNGYDNDFLANVVNIKRFMRNPERYPYLLPEEVAPVEAAFDNLFKTVKTKKTDKGTALYSKGKSRGITVAQAKALLPKRVNRLLDNGTLNIVQSVKNITEDAYSFITIDDIEGFYDQTHDKLFLVADNLSPESLHQVLMHELYHRARLTDTKLQQQIETLDKRLETRFKLAAKGKGSAIEKAAYNRVIKAETPVEDQLEEFAAYMITQWNKDPNSLTGAIRKWVEDLVSAIRAVMIRNGFVPKQITAADLNALALYGARFDVSVSDNKILKSAKAQGYKGDNKGEAQEWLRAKEKGLDMSKEARMKRAKDMGFDVDTKYYHGTNADLKEFDISRSRSEGDSIFVSSSKNQANTYADKSVGANVIPVFIRGDFLLSGYSGITAEEAVKKNLIDEYIESVNKFNRSIDYNKRQYFEGNIEKAKAKGKDGVIFRETEDNAMSVGFIEPASVVAIFNPNQIRSIHAAFDPDYADSGNLLASVKYSREQGEGVNKAKEKIKSSFDSLANSSSDELKSKAKHFIEKTIHSLDSMGPLKDLPNQDVYLTQRYLALGKIAKVDEVAKEIYSSFKDAGEDQANVFKFLTDKTVKPTIIKNEQVRADAVKTKKMIIDVGQRLVDRGLLDAETYEANKGSYLPQIYLMHLLDDSTITALGSGKKPSTLGYLKKRKDIPEEVRRLIMGQITDPGYLASKGYGQQMRDIALLDWIEQISENKDWVLQQSLTEWKGQKVTPFWLKSEAQRIRAQSIHYTPENKAEAVELANQMDEVANKSLEDGQASIAPDGFKKIPDAPRYGSMRGLIVRAEIYDDIVGTSRIHTGDESIAEQILGYGGMATKFTQLWKWSKVAANPPAQVRNFVSNGILLHLSGVPFHKVPSRVIQAIKEIRENGKHWQVAKEYGVTESTFSAQELYRIERELLAVEAKNANKVSLATLKNIAGWVMDKTGDVYQFSEAIFKTAKIIDEMERGSSASKAALEAQKWMFDYSLVTPSMRYLRNAPVGIPFLTFYMKALPRMLEVAYKRPWSFAPYVAVPFVMTAMVASMADVDNDDVEKLKLALPDWLQKRGHAYFIPAKDEKGRWQAIDFGYFLPWTMWTELVQSGAAGEFGDALQTSGILGGPIPSMISAIQTNTDPFTKKEIVNKNDTPEKQMASLMKYLYDLSMPTWVTSNGFAGKMLDAVNDVVDKQGDIKTTELQAALRLAGVNMYAIEPEKSRANNIRFMKYEISDIKRRRTQLLRDKNLSIEERKNIRDTYAEMIKEKRLELRKYVKDSAVHPNLR